MSRRRACKDEYLRGPSGTSAALQHANARFERTDSPKHGNGIVTRGNIKLQYCHTEAIHNVLSAADEP